MGSNAQHTHDHGQACGHGHAHAHGVDTSTRDGRRRVAIAAALTFSFMFAEVIGGILSGSLALLADAAHMLTDAASLALAWWGYRLAARPADARRTFGFGRYRILAAFTNGLALIGLAIWITLEGLQRLFDPQPVIGPLLLVVALLGLAVNLAAFFVLHGGDQNDLNMRGALWHVVGDLMGSVAAIVAALVIMSTGWTPIDPILSLIVAALICLAGWRITRDAARILANEAPADLCADTITASLSEHLDGLGRLLLIRVWAQTESENHIIVRVAAERGMSAETLQETVRQALRPHFSQDQTTIEVLSQD